MKKSLTWAEKMHPEMKPRIVTGQSAKWKRKYGDGKMLIATPLVVEQLIREVPEGNLTTIHLIREKLAHDFHADYTCPVTTGIFVWIVANATEEKYHETRTDRTPYWRVIKDSGQLNPKYPGGEKHQAKQLKAEGFNIVKTKNGNHLRVADYANHLIAFS